MTKPKTSNRTTQGLRDILFDEIDQLRGENGDPQRAMAVANLAKQIVNTAKVEMEYVRTVHDMKEIGADMMLGSLALGSR